MCNKLLGTVSACVRARACVCPKFTCIFWSSGFINAGKCCCVAALKEASQAKKGLTGLSHSKQTLQMVSHVSQGSEKLSPVINDVLGWIPELLKNSSLLQDSAPGTVLVPMWVLSSPQYLLPTNPASHGSVWSWKGADSPVYSSAGSSSVFVPVASLSRPNTALASSSLQTMAKNANTKTARVLCLCKHSVICIFFPQYAAHQCLASALSLWAAVTFIYLLLYSGRW